MKTLVVDDKQLVVNGILRILNRIDPEGEHTGMIDPDKVEEWIEDNSADVVFLDIEMPEISGIELAERINKISPFTNIIFVTGYADYALEAHKVYASGYLMKPVREEDIVDALAHLRYEINDSANIEVRCFGNFEVLYKGVPLDFKRKKTKELFAYLIDRRGAVCDTDMIIGTLWPDEPKSASRQSLLRNLIADLRKTLRDLGEEDVLIKTYNGLAINTSKIKCDYFDYLKGNREALHKYNGEYMVQYEFASFTQSTLNEKEGL